MADQNTSEQLVPARGRVMTLSPMTRNERQLCLALCAIAVAVFIFLALQEVLRGPLVLQLDPAVTAWLAEHRVHAATTLLIAVTQLHSTVGIDLVVLVVAACLGFVDRRWRDALWLVLTVQSSMLLNVLLKDAFRRPRPELAMPVVHLSTFSFPSGHALASTVLWGCLVWLLPPSRRRWGVALAVVLVALVCLSRVYLGAHFLSDVVAGASEGLFCVCAWRLAYPLFHRDRHSPKLESTSGPVA